MDEKNIAMFIKHFIPWAEVIRARFFATIFRTSSFEHRVLCNLYFTKSFAAMRAYVNSDTDSSYMYFNRRLIFCAKTAVLRVLLEPLSSRSTVPN